MGEPLLAAASGTAVYLPIVMIGVYLTAVLYIGIFAFRRGKTTGEDFFLASRSVGSIVFFLSLFATNMTAVAILGSSGAAYKQGIGIFGMMATISALVIPLSLFVIGTRLWAIGKRFGHMTQVAYFRDRWECSFIGTLIFAVSAFMLLPYLIVSIIGGGTILATLSGGVISYWVGGGVVALVVMGNVFFGGMRGAVWVNVFQTLLFLSFGAVAFAVIGGNLPGGFTQTINHMINTPAFKPLMTRERIPQLIFLSYCFIPLSSIMFPHMAIMCFTAKKVTAFKKTVVLYPLCIMAIWLPCVFLGAIGPSQAKVSAMMAGTSAEMKEWISSPNRAAKPPKLVGILAKSEVPAAKELASAVASSEEPLSAEQFGRQLGLIREASPNDKELAAEIGRLAAMNSDSVLLHMLDFNAPVWLAGLLAAGIISAVMGSDCHQILALSTMFSKDIFEFYGGRKRVGEKGTVFFGRAFIVVANSIAYVIALGRPAIFEIAVRYAFSGFASMAPVMVAALFWKRSTKYGALASTLWVAFCLTGQRILEVMFVGRMVPGKGLMIWQVGGQPILWLSKIGNLSVLGSFADDKMGGFMPVVPMVIGSAVCMVVGSLLTRPPSRETIEKYFAEPAATGVVGAPVRA